MGSLAAGSLRSNNNRQNKYSKSRSDEGLFSNEGIEYKAFRNIEDDADVDQANKLRGVISEANDFIHAAISENPDNKIVIHCMAGKSRSVSLATAYLMTVT